MLSLIHFSETCSCCGEHYDAAAWARLPEVGVQLAPGMALELRNCPCGSTIARELVDTGEPT